MVLTYAEDRAFAALSLGRFPSVGSTRLDWDGAEVIERRDGFDAAELRRTVRAHATADELAVVFWDNFVVPTVALDAALVADQAEAVLEWVARCWIFLAASASASGLLIEFQDGEGLTVARVPKPRVTPVPPVPADYGCQPL
ncbi:hypothetical protein [Streptomyces roseifaciens]|uniref:hypothetical protein n=1 Tax=Streptomyces roseifaciens TaxID=1488406 RepID=UPI00071800C3|nr:hypothetical protein [Streptomyces roseifaciens]